MTFDPLDDPESLERLRSELQKLTDDRLDGPASLSVLPGGRSKLTVEVAIGSRHWVLRRPPLAEADSGMHNVGREFRVMSALVGSPVPVPSAVLLYEDARLLGAPFVVMEKVQGDAFSRAADLAVLGPERTRDLARRLIETLANLHMVDVEGVGLSDFGKPAGFAARQLRLWSRELVRLRGESEQDVSRLLQSLVERIGDQLQPEGAVSLVHGDYRLDNTLVDRRDEIAAVIDWEMSTLGDARADLALLLVYREMADLAKPGLLPDAMEAPGFLTADEMVALYWQARGLPPQDLRAFLGIGFLKFAAIMQGVQRRFEHSDGDPEMATALGGLVLPALERGWDATMRP